MSNYRETPCDYGDCPYNAMYFRDCEYYCHLGVDDDEPDYEDIFDGFEFLEVEYIESPDN